ncbi:enoyl-CoA hydratase/isomerase family protein [Wenyingzhuangia aestuarii]|uniref:enoyl-CoA hydratase/isomerase family protein n=1 Tax=Wenyingzhuangia aestuarii TaxID=1647582 RepID=UPI001438F144|nr:enoyl-CoA hydratase/isomerase family protein [Wenyingzhuangia aestuarii]NJB82025.1 methylglutaconyl-CoA hydratase [Wenyingzhuangia aestuarii]
MDLAYVKATLTNRVAEIEFYSPASNSLNSEQLKQLSKAILSFDDREDVSVIHLKSSGEKAFCAGASFDELLEIETLDKGTAFFMGFANVINAIRKSHKIVVTSIQGKTVGGGVGIAAASDYVFATDQASVKLSELSIGIGPFVIEPAVSRKIGLANFTELTLNPTEWKTAVWAKEVGLYAKVATSVVELNKGVSEFLKQLTTYNSQALSALKRTLWKDNTDDWGELLKERAAISGKLVLSEETKKALAQFKNK